jgi:hypothetical protein
VPEVISAEDRCCGVRADTMPNMAVDSALTGSSVVPSTWNDVGSEPTNWGVWLTLSPL